MAGSWHSPPARTLRRGLGWYAGLVLTGLVRWAGTDWAGTLGWARARHAARQEAPRKPVASRLSVPCPNPRSPPLPLLSRVGERLPCITYGMRGMISLSIEVRGPQRDLHSGNEGGVFAEPLADLSKVGGGAGWVGGWAGRRAATSMSMACDVQRTSKRGGLAETPLGWPPSPTHPPKPRCWPASWTRATPSWSPASTTACGPPCCRPRCRAWRPPTSSRSTGEGPRGGSRRGRQSGPPCMLARPRPAEATPPTPSHTPSLLSPPPTSRQLQGAPGRERADGGQQRARPAQRALVPALAQVGGRAGARASLPHVIPAPCALLLLSPHAPQTLGLPPSHPPARPPSRSVVDVRVGTTEEQASVGHYRFGPTRFSVIPKAAVRGGTRLGAGRGRVWLGPGIGHAAARQPACRRCHRGTAAKPAPPRTPASFPPRPRHPPSSPLAARPAGGQGLHPLCARPGAGPPGRPAGRPHPPRVCQAALAQLHRSQGAVHWGCSVGGRALQCPFGGVRSGLAGGGRPRHGGPAPAPAWRAAE